MRSLVVACLLALGSASAYAAGPASLEWLGQDGRVPPDGFLLGLVVRHSGGIELPKAEVTATGADLSPLPAEGSVQPYWVTPRAGVPELRVEARQGALVAEQRCLVGPPASHVELVLDPAAPVKGKDSAASLTVRIVGLDGRPDPDSAPPVLVASVGKVEGLERTAPGVFRGRYVLPATRHPEVAVVIAFSAWPHPQSVHGAVGALRIPLASSIEMPGFSEKNAKMTLFIAGVPFGPVEVAPDGRFSIPVIVPPGHPSAEAKAVDRAGNQRSRTLDLQVPPTDPLACVMNPRTLPGDGRARGRIVCATSDPFGRPVNAKVQLRVRHGVVVPVRSSSTGIREWLYTAPRMPEGGTDAVEATWMEARAAARESFAVTLVQGPAKVSTLSGIDPVVHGGSPIPFRIDVKDAFDKPRPEAQVQLQASVGAVISPREIAPGRFEGVWRVPPGELLERAQLSVSALGPLGTDPARLVAWMRGDAILVGVTDLAGLPVPKQTVRVGKVSLVSGADGTAEVPGRPSGPLVIVHEQWPGLRLTLHTLPRATLFPASPPLGAPVSVREVTVAPEIPVNVRIQVRGKAVTYWVEDSEGKTLSPREVVLSLSSGRASPEGSTDGKTTVRVTTDGRVSVAVTDRETGVTALAEVVP